MSETKFYAVVQFEDGLQVIPSNWLKSDYKATLWPNFTNNNRYGKMVKSMEEPESSWLEHNIVKIYGIFDNYSVARKKLKKAEDLSDLTSNTEKEEHLKKSRKVRAKNLDTSMSSDESGDSFLSQLLKISKVSNMHKYSTKSKIAKNAQKDCNKNVICKKYERKVDIRHTITSWYTSFKEGGRTDNSQLQKQKISDSLSSFNSTIVRDCNKNLESQSTSFSNTDRNKKYDDVPVASSPNCNVTDYQFAGNASYETEELWCDTDTNILFPPSNLNRNYTQDAQCAANLIHREGKRNIGVADNGHLPSKERVQEVLHSQSNLQGKNFQKFLIRKVLNLEIILNDIKKNQKAILEKLSMDSFYSKEKENMDTLNNFPLRNQNNLNMLEIKLQNKIAYRHLMIS